MILLPSIYPPATKLPRTEAETKNATTRAKELIGQNTYPLQPSCNHFISSGTGEIQSCANGGGVSTSSSEIKALFAYEGSNARVDSLGRAEWGVVRGRLGGDLGGIGCH